MMSDNKRIARNSILLYVRMLFIMGIGFYTSRIVLEALGVDDYGIFSLVGGLISVIAMLNSSLANASSRFITYALGQNNLSHLKKVFSTSFSLHLSLSVVFLIVGETIGLWFINSQLNIAADRMVAANWVYQAAVWSTTFGITQIPYNACLTSHEKFDVFALIEVLNAALKLCIAFAVLYSPLDHLIVYSVLYASVALSIMMFYRFYCTRRFEECEMSLSFDRPIMKEMLSFSGWGLVNSGSFTIAQQGTNFFINRFFGVWLNAAVGVSQQVQGILYSFIGNINMAFSPQIVKEYAKKNYSRMNNLVNMGAQFSAVVTIILSIPVIICMPFLMGLWLKTVPDGAVVIAQLMLVVNIFNSFNAAPSMGVTATGRIKWLNICCSMVYFLQLLLIYIVLRQTHSYVVVFAIGVVPPILTGLLYIFMLQHLQPSFRALKFLMKTYIPLLLIAGLSYWSSRAIGTMVNNEWLRVLCVGVSSVVLTGGMYYMVVMPFRVRKEIRKKIAAYIRK